MGCGHHAHAVLLGDDPERMDASAVISARALRRAVIRNDPTVVGYLYLVCINHFAARCLAALAHLPSRHWYDPAIVALTTLLAAWMTAGNQPLARLTAAVGTVTQHGLEHFSADATAAQSGTSGLLAGLAQTSSRDEFGQLSHGIRAMLNTLRTQWSTLRRLDHFRREGVSNLSHDLRSPLTATTACLETLENRWAGDAGRAADRQLVEVALCNIQNAVRLVQALGDLAQLDEPEFKLRTEVMDVSELLDDVAVRFAERAERQGIRVVTAEHVDSSAPLAAVDVELFERAIANLVDNALKFCPTGATIMLDAEPVGTHVEVTVSDTGPGIPATDLPHLFDRFYQSRQSVAPATGEGGKRPRVDHRKTHRRTARR